jgi:hypothetical protein
MAHLLVNGQPVPLETGQKTWRELLGSVDAEAASRAEAVTAVRFEGVDQPTFRDSDVGEAVLAGIARIEVETLPRQRLLRTTLGAAGQSLPAVASGACQAAAAFRRGSLDEGHQQLSVVLATLRTLVELTLASAAVAGADLSRLPCGAVTAAGVLSAVSGVLDTLAQSQRDHDWTALAEGLEFDLAPAVLQWGLVFDAMHEGWAA